MPQAEFISAEEVRGRGPRAMGIIAWGNAVESQGIEGTEHGGEHLHFTENFFLTIPYFKRHFKESACLIFKNRQIGRTNFRLIDENL